MKTTKKLVLVKKINRLVEAKKLSKSSLVYVVFKNEIDINESFFNPCVRPQSLRGIETNNGWIKIESEAQHDELENGEYEWYNIKTGKYDKGDLWAYGIFTHYKLIPKLKIIPPIY